MGNCSSEHQHQSRLFRAENFTNVFVKKRNKFIPGWLKINDDEIVFSRGGNNFQFWPLAHLRRYGYTCSGVFFFESGRRCATGEGLHTFQSHQAERIFHMVQSKIKIEEYARCGSRAGSVASNGTHRVHSLVPNPGAAARIHPIQRFSSEGANNEFPPSAAAAADAAPSAPPPYSAYAAAAAASDTRRVHQNASPNSHCPSIVSAASSSMIPQHFVRSAAGGAMAVPPALSRDRPRSVVSNIEHGVVLHHRLPHLLQTTAGQLPPLQSHVATAPPPPAPPLLHQHRPPPPPSSNVAASSSASSLMAAAMIHAQQQQQQNGGYALSPAALAASASGSCMMNQSFHSVLDSTGGSGGSPWASQQQLEGEIVLEHVLGIDNRRRLAQQQQQKSGHSPNPTAEPIRVAVPPPPRPFQQQQQQQRQHVQAVFSGTELHKLQQAEDPSVLVPTAAPPAARFRRCGESTAAYVNVDFDVGCARHVAHEGDGILPECMNQQQLNVRELHRTDHSRMEFLSTGPGAFMLSSSYGPMSMSTSMVASPSSHATALPPALIHHHHHQQQHLQHVQQQYPQQCLHHSFYAPRPSASFQQQMSASVSGALTTSNQPPPPPTPLLQANNESGAGGDEDGISRRNDAQFHPCGGPTINLLSPIKLMSPPHAGVMQQHQSNPPLSNTTTASSTPS
uniref:IRS-type PTB domain-containing protein n=1 Tax=Globodera rostochiensis TaxID=31243 RepID=A0A914IFA2_GLORO